MSATKSIVILAPSAYVVSGLAAWLDYLMPGIEAAGFDVALALAGGKHHDVDKYLAAHPFDRIHRLYNKTGSRQGRVNAVATMVSSLSPDLVVNVNIADSYDAVRCLRLRHGTQFHFITTLHGIQADILGDVAANADIIDGVVSPSRFLCNVAESVLAGSQCRVMYAPCGVDQTAAFPRKIPDTLDRITLGYCGRLDDVEKRVSDLVAIARALAEKQVKFHLLIAGEGPYEATMRAELNSSGLAGHVTFLGFIPRSRLHEQFYSRCDAVLITSASETGPIVAWEAMASNVVFVSSAFRGSSSEQALQDAVNCLLFPIGDISTAVDKIMSLFSSSLRKTLAANARVMVLQRYTEKVSIEQWLAAFREVMSSAPSKRPAHKLSLPPSGRLDAMLGTSLAEKMRAALGIRFLHSSAGGEWPHSYSAEENSISRRLAEEV